MQTLKTGVKVKKNVNIEYDIVSEDDRSTLKELTGVQRYKYFPISFAVRPLGIFHLISDRYFAAAFRVISYMEFITFFFSPS